MKAIGAKALLLAVAYYAVLLAVCFGVGGGVAALTCRAHWQGTGISYRWRGFFSGCQVEVRPGRWLPESAYLEPSR